MYTMNCVYLSSIYNSCPERLCEEIGQILNKDDSCGHLHKLFIYGVNLTKKNMHAYQCFVMGQLENIIFSTECSVHFLTQLLSLMDQNNLYLVQ